MNKCLFVFLVFANGDAADVEITSDFDQGIPGIERFEVSMVAVVDELFECWSVITFMGDEELVMGTFAGGIDDDDFPLAEFRLHGIIGDLHGKTAFAGFRRDRDPGDDLGIEVFFGCTTKFGQFVPGDQGDSGNEREGALEFAGCVIVIFMSGIGTGAGEGHFTTTGIKPDGIDATGEGDGNGFPGRAGSTSFKFMNRGLADADLVCKFLLGQAGMFSGLFDPFVQGAVHGGCSLGWYSFSTFRWVMSQT